MRPESRRGGGAEGGEEGERDVLWFSKIMYIYVCV